MFSALKLDRCRLDHVFRVGLIDQGGVGFPGIA
jgi:hypothetical protein